MKTFFKKYYFFIITMLFSGIMNCGFKYFEYITRGKYFEYRGKAQDKNINFELYNKNKAPIVFNLYQKGISIEDVVIPAGAKCGIILENPKGQFEIYFWYKEESLEILRSINQKRANDEMGLTAQEFEVSKIADYLATINPNNLRKKIYLAFENNHLRPRQAQLGGLLNTSESGLSLTGNVKQTEIQERR